MKKLQIYLDETYNEKYKSVGYEYYNAQNIYYKLGYWDEEIYRLGIVYILPNGELTPVFNIRGCSNIVEYNSDLNLYSDIPLYLNNKRNYVNYNETDY